MTHKGVPSTQSGTWLTAQSQGRGEVTGLLAACIAVLACGLATLYIISTEAQQLHADRGGTTCEPNWL